MTNAYSPTGPTREEVDATQGPLLLDFGTDWCGHCQLAAPAVEAALTEFSAVQHLKIEDGQGRKLGRSFRVKLWPTLVALKDGVEVARAVRPTTVEEVRTALTHLQ